ncbi:MAG: hypothetical protein AB7H97_07660 [Pseudobdellovibrionaceae bacterium]
MGEPKLDPSGHHESESKQQHNGNKPSSNSRLPDIKIMVLAFLGLAGLGYFGFQILFSNPAETVLKKYLDARSWEARLDFVRKPDVVKPLMIEWYKEIDFSKGKPYLRLEADPETKASDLKEGGWTNIRVVFAEGQNAFGSTVQDAAWYSLQLTSSGFKIDWEASVSYNPMTFKAMQAQKPTDPQKFRVFAELANYYNYEFRDSDSYLYSIRLHEPETYESVYGYIKRDSPDGKRLYEILKDGQKHPVILNVRYHPYASQNNLVIIDTFVQRYFNEP